MPEHTTTVKYWLELAHPDLTDHVRRAVRRGASMTPLWTEVAAHPVLTARVRGILSALSSEMAHHRDHAMWTVWINAARRALNATPADVAVDIPPALPTPSAAPDGAVALEAVTASGPPARRHTVAPVTFLAAGQASANAADR